MLDVSCRWNFGTVKFTTFLYNKRKTVLPCPPSCPENFPVLYERSIPYHHPTLKGLEDRFSSSSSSNEQYRQSILPRQFLAWFSYYVRIRISEILDILKWRPYAQRLTHIYFLPCCAVLKISLPALQIDCCCSSLSFEYRHPSRRRKRLLAFGVNFSPTAESLSTLQLFLIP